MARPGGLTLALGAAVALAAVPALAIPAGAAPTRSGTVTAGDSAPRQGVGVGAAQAAASAPVRGNEVVYRTHGGPLRRVKIKAGVDPRLVAERLRARPGLFASAGANLIARAAGSRMGPTDLPTTPPATAAQGPPATTPGTTPTPAPSTPPSPVDPPADNDIPGPPAGLAGWIPNDHIGDVPWTSLQWNFVGQWGVNATKAWGLLRDRGSRNLAGRGVRIAVVDSGIAYRTRGKYRQSPDLPSDRILKGYDFVDEDRYPDDVTGHGTHVASLIAGATDNDAGVTGLAYNAEILAIRVLDDEDEGDVVAIARGVRYAVRRQADIINLSVDFPVSMTAAEIPEVMAAIAYARRNGVLVVASSGNNGSSEVALPARSSSVLSVGATTAHGCRAEFSNAGPALDLVAPGGGTDHRSERSSRCRPGEAGPPIAQVTLLRSGDPTKLGVPLDYIGTSMAAAHVTAVAALVRASGVIGRDPSPELLAAYLVRSTRDLGPKGRDERYGAGLIDAAKAIDRRKAKAAVRGARRAVAQASRTTSGLPVR